MEFNYNNLVEKQNYGCYLGTTYSSSYESANGSKYYDSGNRYKFFEKGGVQKSMSGTSGNTITVNNNTGISIGMRASGEKIPADTYVTNINSTTITLSKNIAGTISAGTSVTFYEFLTAEDTATNAYSPLSSVFEQNRPDPGIINLFAYRKGSSIISSERLKVGNFGSANNGARTDRVYPIYKESKFRYWSSVRQVISNNIPTVIGLSAATSPYTISNAAPFIVYSQSFNINKITIKTQKYQGYATTFKVEYLLDGQTTWTSPASLQFTDSSVLSTGKLNLYYNGSTWSTTETSATQLVSSATDSIKICGIRLSVSKMSAGNIPLEVIEISPRLQIDVSDYVTGFDKSSSIEASISGVPASGIISGTGTLSLFNQNDYFSINTTNSIISPYLYQGIEVRAYQTINSETIQVGTMYTTSWNDSGNSQVSIQLEDYFFFLKRQKAPDISIANISGIETSVAVLILLDNAGITNYEYVKSFSGSKDDFVMDFFFCSQDQTIAEVLGEIAVSSQCVVYVDAKNTIKVVSRDSFASNFDIGSTNYWLVGTEDWSGKAESTYLNNNYVSNIVSIAERKIEPITEMSVSYSGNGIARQPKAILESPEVFDNNVPFYNASIISRNLSYVNTELWSVESEDGKDKVLLSMPYIVDMTTTRPSVISNGGSARNTKELISTIYSTATATEKKYFEIVVDQERGIEFLQSQKFNGYIQINSELIKYNGIIIDVFDPKTPANSGRKIVFSSDEVQYIRNSSSSGVSIYVYSLLVELVFKPVISQSLATSNNIQYSFVSDGRAQENTIITAHTSSTSSSFTNKYKTRLFSDTVSSTIEPIASMVAESVNPKDPRLKNGDNKVSYPGYLKLSGPKSVGGANKASGIAAALDKTKYLPIDNYGERFITGTYKTIDFTPSVISTRIRLLEKPAKYQSTVKTDTVSPENRGIAGIGFSLEASANGTTGYFIEIEDVGNITGKQLENEMYKNLRFYKVTKIGGVYTPIVLGDAWVNTNATAGESIDFGTSAGNEGKSYATTSDLMVTITDIGKSLVYKIYWETNLVVKYVESKSDTLLSKGNTVATMVRSDSVALFDYMLCIGLSKDGSHSVPTIFKNGSSYIKAVEAAERGVLPSVISDAAVANTSMKFDFEDFGNQIREAKKYKVRFNNPAISAHLISLERLNKDYAVSNFSASSFGAEFWVFNTSRASIGLSLESSTPVIISGVALEGLNPGEVLLSTFLKNKSGDASDKLLFNKNKYGENSVSYGGKFINNLEQAESILEWIWEKRSYEKRAFDVEIFPNPLLEIGDRIRLFDSNISHTIEKSGDKCYYISSITYSVGDSGQTMSLSIEEI